MLLSGPSSTKVAPCLFSSKLSRAGRYQALGRHGYCTSTFSFQLDFQGFLHSLRRPGGQLSTFPGTEEVPGCGTLSFKTGKILDKLGQPSHTSAKPLERTFLIFFLKVLVLTACFGHFTLHILTCKHSSLFLPPLMALLCFSTLTLSPGSLAALPHDVQILPLTVSSENTPSMIILSPWSFGFHSNSVPLRSPSAMSALGVMGGHLSDQHFLKCD